MKRIVPVLLATICIFNQLHAQTCNATTFDVDLSASIDTTVSFQSTRNGDCCTGTNCIRFNLTINLACSFVNFTVQNPAPPGNAAYYQVDCGTPTSLGTPICIVGKTNVVITFCKPGNDDPIYTITAAGALKGSDDITVREGCTGVMTVAGLLPATINWTSIFPGVQGAYNGYLSCTSGCTSTNVTPQTGSPSYIDYKVSGFRVCGPIVSDTIRVYTKPQIAIAISPSNSSVCAGGSTSVSITATASGGDAPYNFVWNTGQSGQTITVNSGAVYSVSVTDTNNCLPAVQSATVTTTALPAPPMLTSNSPVCEGSSLKLFASTVAGATYSWTGPNGFTSSQQNPVINNASVSDAGTYSVTIKTGQCISIPVSTTVNVNTIPPTPSLSNNSPVCEGTNLNLTASNIAGASYNWTGPNGFTSTNQNVTISNAVLSNAGIYNVTSTVNGCVSSPASTTAVVNPLPAAPLVPSNGPLCNGNTISLFAGSINGAVYLWTGPNGFTSSSQNPTITNAGTSASGIYSVTATVNGCTGPASTTYVTVNPIPPTPTVSSNGPICEGSSLSLAASSIAGASYSWSGPNGFTSSSQNPIIINTTAAATGSYSATATVNGCTSAAGNVPVIVNPLPPAPTVSANTPLCQGSTLALTASTIAGAIYSWGGPNGFVSSAQNPTVSNVSLLNTGVYSVNAKVNGCTGPAAIMSVVVNITPSSPAASSNSPVCSGNSISLNASTVTGGTYTWTGPNGFSSTQQNPVISNASLNNGGLYQVSVTVNGCTSATPASTAITVYQTPGTPIAANNGPLCAGSSLNLSASNIAGATYLWTGPNGFSSSGQNVSLPNITSSNKGTYYLTAMLNGCTSAAANTSVIIDQPATVNAGNDRVICASDQIVRLSGIMSGGSVSGVWSTSGTGIFSPANTSLNSDYSVTIADKDSGGVRLTLSSTNNGACPASASSILITFAVPPTANAGNDQTVCANNANVILNGQFTNSTSAVWSTSGSGTFSPSNTSMNATYIPGALDKTVGNIKLTLTTTGNGPCGAASDAMTVAIKSPPPVNNAVKYVIEEGSTVLGTAISGSGLTYSWTPAIYLNHDNIANPICTPANDVSYKLVVQDLFGCTSSAVIAVKILKHPQIPNVFTPNGDGINDQWQIKYLSDYPDCNVDIYDRYGQLVYKSLGYTTAWDGTSKGKQLPAGTYYYIIDPKNNLKPLSGFVDIVK